MASVTDMSSVCPPTARHVRVRACGAAPWCGLAMLLPRRLAASVLGPAVPQIGVAAALASVPCGHWAMRRAVCLQMFSTAALLNQDLGTWNVASVTTMSSVCPPTARRACVRACGAAPRAWAGLAQDCLGAWPLRRFGRPCEASGCSARIGAVRALGDAARGLLADVLHGNSVQPKPRKLDCGLGLGHDICVHPIARLVRVRACGAAPRCGLALLTIASALGRFGAGAGVPHMGVAAVLASVPCGHWAMRRAVCLQMFSSATAFNQNLGKWNVASVTTMSGVCPLTARRACVRACGAAPRCGLALLKIASALGRFGAWAGVSHVGVAAVLASVPCGHWAMRRAVCSQTLSYTTAFDQALGTWNVASVSNMFNVCPLVPVACACGHVGPRLGVG
jgi:surface protein